MLNIKNKFLFVFQFLVLMLNYLFNKKFNEKKLIQQNLPKEAIVFDIGSNLGTYIKLVSISSKKKKINFHSFEPSKRLCEQQEKLSLCKEHSLIINNKAVNNKNTRMKFYERSINSHSSLVESPKVLAEVSKVLETYDVDTLTIDSYCEKNNITKIDLMKIDAEGFDFQVLESSEKLLKENKIKLIIRL